MVVGKVVGSVVCSKKDESLEGRKISVVQPINIDTLKAYGQKLVALDPLGSGPEEIVLVVGGSSARLAGDYANKVTVDQSIVAIIDLIEVNGEYRYKKGYTELPS
jgi:ethanolamine utilization protein EutN